MPPPPFFNRVQIQTRWPVTITAFAVINFALENKACTLHIRTHCAGLHGTVPIVEWNEIQSQTFDGRKKRGMKKTTLKWCVLSEDRSKSSFDAQTAVFSSSTPGPLHSNSLRYSRHSLMWVSVRFGIHRSHTRVIRKNWVNVEWNLRHPRAPLTCSEFLFV